MGDVSDRHNQLEKVKQDVRKYDFIRFTFLDMNAIPRTSLIPSEAAVGMLESGIGCFSGLQAFGPRNEIIFPKEVLDNKMGNIRTIPDLTTLHPVPWLCDEQSKTAQFLCSTYWDKSTPQEACSRNILKKLLTSLEKDGYKIYSGFELEYYLLDRATREPVFGCAFQTGLIQTEFHPWMTEIALFMRKSGVSLERLLNEYAAGQFEFCTAPTEGIDGVDAIVKLKQAVKEVAHKKGWEANFMAKRSLAEIGNGFHMNFSVWDMEKLENQFWDSASEDGLSDFAKHWIAGLCEHAPALTALCCPTLNCYMRLHSPWTPQRANWGVEDRMAMLRVKNSGPKSTYFENRMPSGLANPYLAMAATVAAGYDGVKRKLKCPEPHDYKNPTELPHTLQEALDALQNDKFMVEALGKTFVEWFVMSKTESEIKKVEGLSDDELLNEHVKMYAKHF